MKRICNLFRWLLGPLPLLAGLPAWGQCSIPAEHLLKRSSETEIGRLAEAYGRNKSIPTIYRMPVLMALSHFPELTDTRIRFIIKHVHGPLTTNRDWGYFLGHWGRKAFTITISDSTEARLEPILLGKMDLNAQVGVIGHELSHVSAFSRMRLPGWFGVGFGHLSTRYIDRMEFATDSLCIAHGLGYQLLSWSCLVRRSLGITKYGGSAHPDMPPKRERYMNPSTIIARLPP